MQSGEPALWNFALEIYGTGEARNACLALQDGSSVDVLVLLFALWLARNSVALAEEDLPQIDSRVAEWRSKVVRPLREARRFLKQSRPPDLGDEAEALRQKIMAVELESERLALKFLESEGLKLLGHRDEARSPVEKNATTVVRYYRRTELDAESRDALGKILAAYMRVSSDVSRD